ncbi:ribosome biogenesis GTP-binding protein YihA/YsxC [Haloimpatiens lingqiaonensis]|uniref:ribosome biogenesis GTP-binding protein YihA/YsxC n=1 Tax=Haloimpatiens lingqiaonensis TaxID=1380675 RepID=UPI0010FE1184|nr:ribosome biogenesis GTP-binding protein YihA/YsxC [Haloimpatiens lingqiaonensis]
MEIKKAEFIISAVKKEQYPQNKLAEVAFVGRSNAGKSSLINTLTNRRKLAKTSGTPGKTRLVNFFLINDDMYFVDLPGYGYAKVSKKEKESWVKVIETYLVDREPLEKVVLLVDCRHKPTEDDVMMYNWIKHYNYKPIVVATKADKISNNELFKNLKVIRETLGMSKEEQIIKFSSLKKVGVQELINAIYE